MAIEIEAKNYYSPVCLCVLVFIKSRVQSIEIGVHSLRLLSCTKIPKSRLFPFLDCLRCSVWSHSILTQDTGDAEFDFYLSVLLSHCKCNHLRFLPIVKAADSGICVGLPHQLYLKLPRLTVWSFSCTLIGGITFHWFLVPWVIELSQVHGIANKPKTLRRMKTHWR